ncbi:MAG: serine hydrolase [Anaerovoracaceae bacterium]
MNIFKKRISLVISIVLLVNLFAINAYASTQTPFTGLATSIQRNVSSSIKDVIKVQTDAHKFAILQIKSDKTGTWSDQKVYPLDDDGNTLITINYPSLWKKSTKTVWRMLLTNKEEDTSTDISSPEINIFAKNIKKLPLSARGVVIYSVDDDKVLYEKSMSTPMANASTTKVMSAIVALKNYKPNQKVKISNYAARTPWGSLYMTPGDIYYMKDLMHAMLIESSNDASVAIGEGTAGSASAFVKRMNNHAAALGLKNTQFKNTHGLDAKGHYTSPYDLALTMKDALKYPEFREMIRDETYVVKNAKRTRSSKIETTNRMLTGFDTCIGGKTGTETNAKYCFVGAYKVNGKTFIAVNLGSASPAHRWNDAKTLYKYIKTYGNY